MKLQHRAAALTAAAVLALSTVAAPLTAFAASESAPAENGILDLLPAPLRDLIDPENAPLRIAEQGIFSAGGTVIRSDGTFDVGNYYTSREGSTAHVDHANVLYQIPENDTELPMVFLHGYGQSRMGWMTTPDGREGWSDMFLRKGHSVWLIDQPRRGEAGQTSVAGTMTTTPLGSDLVHPVPHRHLPQRSVHLQRGLSVPPGRGGAGPVLPADDP